MNSRDMYGFATTDLIGPVGKTLYRAVEKLHSNGDFPVYDVEVSPDIDRLDMRITPMYFGSALDVIAELFGAVWFVRGTNLYVVSEKYIAETFIQEVGVKT